MAGNEISIWQQWSEKLPLLQFGGAAGKGESDGDIISRLIAGEIDELEFSHNFQRCSFQAAVITNSKLRNVDFKDCAFVDSTFVGCDISAGSTVSCTYSNCTFVGCSFSDAAFHECIYQDCTFTDCDFRSSMLRNSRIENCEFSDSQTSNKLFDGCLMFDNRFRGTQLDFRAIIDNFGLDSRQIGYDLIRQDRSYPNIRPFDFEAGLGEDHARPANNEFELLRLNYYLTGGELVGSKSVDRVFEPEAWLSMVRAPINFVRLLQDLSSFILHLYDSDNTPALFVVKLSLLTDSIWSSFQGTPSGSHLAQIAAGIHLQCLQRMQDLDRACNFIIGRSEATKLVYESFDYASDEEIEDLANKVLVMLPGADLTIRPRNSPVDIVFSIGNSATFLIGVYVFLNSKLRFQLLKPQRGSASPDEAGTFFNIEVGGAGPNEQTSLINLSAQLPKIATFRFEVNFTSALLSSLRNVVKDVRTER